MSETKDLTSELKDLADHNDPQAINEDKLYPILATCANQHIFERRSGNEAKCRNCPLGYYLSPGMDVVNGHIVIHGDLVI